MPRLRDQTQTYCFRVEFLKDKTERIHEVALTQADFTRAVEATFFDGLRRGVFTLRGSAPRARGKGRARRPFQSPRPHGRAADGTCQL